MRASEGPAPELPPPPGPVWETRSPPDADDVAALRAALGLPAPLCALLAVRGLQSPPSAKEFLRPLLDSLHPPEGLRDAPRAAERIASAVERRETILVHGDYDVDGISATALLTRGLREMGGEVVPFIPHRVRDGYDLGPAGMRAAEESGASLLVTVDCGIVAHEAVSRARSQGIDVVVTDHHTPSDSLPSAYAVVNPNRSDCSYPWKGLAGVGVAFKVLLLTADRLGTDREALLRHLDLVALATVADLVPLEGENRVLVRFGLRALSRTEKPGLNALLRSSGLEGKEVDAGQVGFVLAPRINAAGRISDPDRALRLLLTEDSDEAERLANVLEEQNRKRREEEGRTAGEAFEALAAAFRPNEDFGVVVASEGWHPGVIGIVASRVVERIHRPVVLVALDGDGGRGSARSIPGFDLFEAVQSCSGDLERFGGHRQAAGLDIRAERLPAFREAFNEAARKGLKGIVPVPRLSVDLELPLGSATEELHHFLRYVGPFGIGNPRPVFFRRGLEVAGSPREVGRGHLKLRLREGETTLDAIGFGLCGRIPPAGLNGCRVDVAFQLRENEYRGTRSLQARLLDVRLSGVAG